MLPYGISLFSDFDLALSDIFHTNWTEAPPPSFAPPVDLIDDGDKYTLLFDVPGVSLKDLTIEVKDLVLTISGERPNGKKSLYGERRTGKFSRAFSLNKNADPESVEASLTDGVLSVTIAKKSSAKPKRIDIKSG